MIASLLIFVAASLPPTTQPVFPKRTEFCSYGLVKDSTTQHGIYTSYQGARCSFPLSQKEAVISKLRDYYFQQLVQNRNVILGPTEVQEPAEGVLYEVQVVPGTKSKEGKQETLLGTFVVSFWDAKDNQLAVTSRSIKIQGVGPDAPVRRLDLDFLFEEDVEAKELSLEFRSTVSIKKPWYAFVSDEEFTKLADKTTWKKMKMSVEDLEREIVENLSH